MFSEQFLLISLIVQDWGSKNKCWLNLCQRLLRGSCLRKKANQTSKCLCSVLIEDLPDDEVAALSFSQEGVQFHGDVLCLLRLAVLIACRHTQLSHAVLQYSSVSISWSQLTHSEVNVAFSSAHHQHGLASLLSCGICGPVSGCLSSAGCRRNCMTWKQRNSVNKSKILQTVNFFLVRTPWPSQVSIDCNEIRSKLSGFVSTLNEFLVGDQMIHPPAARTGSRMVQTLSGSCKTPAASKSSLSSLTWNCGEELDCIPVTVETELSVSHGAVRNKRPGCNFVTAVVPVHTNHTSRKVTCCRGYLVGR